MVNLDASTATTLVAEGSVERAIVKSLLAGRRMLMCMTALAEFQGAVAISGGPLESARAARLIARADQPSARAMKLKPTGSLGAADIVILGTGDALGIATITADRRSVSAALAQGVSSRVLMHPSGRLTGK